MPATRLVLVGGLLLMLAGLWFVFAQEPATAADPAADPAAAQGSLAPGAGESTDSTGAAGTLDRATAAAAAGGIADDWTHAEGPRFTVRVLDLFARTPIAAAELWVFDPDHYDRDLLRAALTRTHDDWEPHVKTFARRVVADERGEVSLPQPADWFRILGRSGQQYGELFHPRGADGQIATLYLEPDRSLRVLTTDARGAPLAGVPVGLREQGGDWSWWRDERVTDEEGRAVFAHLQDSLGTLDPGTRLFLAAAVAHREAPQVALDVGELPTEEQVLVIPAHGSLRVLIYDADRRPYRQRAVVALQGAWTEGVPEWYDEDEGFEPLASHGVHTVTVEQGEAFFPYVGIGVPLTVAVDFDGLDEWERLAAHGPESAGATVTVECFQTVLRPSFQVRLLDPDGQPLRDATVLVQDRFTTASWSNVSTREARTDEHGGLRRPIGEDWNENEPGTRRWIEFVREADPQTGAAELGARIEGRAAWRAGVNDLGDVRLEPLPLLVSGIVLDPAGAPVARADVAMAQRFVRSRGRETWRADRDTRGETGRDGRFSIHGFAREGTYRIEARHRNHAMTTVPWVSGGEEHRLQFEAGRFVLGQVLRDPATSYDALEVELVEPGSGRAQSSSQIERNGHFRCGPGVPAFADLVVREDSSDRVLWRVPGVASHELAAPPDPRLDPLDLRGKIRRIEVVCRTPDGEEIGTDLSYALNSGPADGEPEEWSWSATGRFGFLVGEGTTHLWIRAEKYKQKDLIVDADRMEVVLEPGPRVRFVLSDRGLLGVGERLYLELTRKAEEEDSWWVHLTSEEVEEVLSLPGNYEARLFVAVVDAEGDWIWHSYPPEDVLSFQVQDVVGAQTVRLPWTAAEVQAAITAGAEED